MAEDDTSSESGARGGGLADALRRYVDAVVGVSEVSRERAEKIVRELAERGETRTNDIQKAARDLADRSARNQRDLARLISKEIKRQVESLGLATRDDVGQLQRRVKDLEDGPASDATTADAEKGAENGGTKKPSAKKPKPKKKTQ